MKKSILLFTAIMLAGFMQAFSQETAKQVQEILEVKNQLLNNQYYNQTDFKRVRPNRESSFSDTDYGNAPDWDWSNLFGGSGKDQSVMVGFDDAGNTIITGYFSGEINYGNVTLNSTGDNDAFVAKIDTLGNILWFKQLSATKKHNFFSFALTISGNDIYITGSYTGSITLGNFTLPDKNDYNLCFVKLNSNGDVVFAKNIEDTSDSSGQIGMRILVNSNYDIYILSHTSVSCYLLKLNQAGEVLYSFSTNQYIKDFYIQGDNIYFVGYIKEQGYIGDIFFDDPPGFRDAFVAKCNSNFNVEWAWMVDHENSGNSTGVGIFADDNGNLFFSGYFSGDIKLGDFVLSGRGSFLTKFTDTTNFVWVRKVTSGNIINKYITGNNDCLLLSYWKNGIIKVDASTGSVITDKSFDKTVNYCIPDKENNHIYFTGNKNGLIYLTKTDNNFNETWNFNTGGDSGDGWVISTETDNNNNFYTYGYASNAIKYFGENLEKGTFICKQNADGRVLWVHQFSELSVSATYGVYSSLDPSFENIFIGGFFTESFTLPNGEVLTPAEGGSIFVMEFGAGGNYKDVFKIDVPNGDLFCISTDRNDNVILTGIFTNTITIGSNELTSRGSQDTYVVKFSMNNKTIDWVLQAGGEDVEYSSLVTTDQNNNVFFTGEFDSENVLVGDASITMEEGDGNILLAKISPEGELQWLKSVAGSVIPYNDYWGWPTGIDVDNSGYFYVKGWHGDSTYFDEHLVTSPYGWSSKFIAKFDSSGHCIWINSINETHWGWDYNKMAVDMNNNVYFGMNIRDTIYYGDDFEYDPVGNMDLMLAKYLPDGTLDWVKTMPGEESNFLKTVSVYDSTITIGGFLTNSLTIGDSNFIVHNSHGFLAQCGKDYTGFNEVYNRKNQSLKIFPNPLVDHSFVEFENKDNSDYTLEIFNLAGQNVFKMNNIKTNKVTIYRGALSKGVYLIKLTGKNSYSGKLLVR